MKSVTILVTVKNNSETIKKCIDSLLKQSYRNKKIYVTDAYSTDETYEILKKYGKKIKLERIHGNMSVAYNYMLRKVKTEFVAFIDGDAVADKNWLKTLINSFEKDVVAVGGKPKTPKTNNKLQELIGRELEYRFDKLPKYVSRLPTMNLCVKTKIAKKTKFRTDLDVAQETEWGYRLTKLGKMIYQPKAVVWHYHRATWENYFKQQYKYAKFARSAYKDHEEKKGGDELTTSFMVAQIPLLYLSIIFFILPFKIFSTLFTLTFGILLLLYAYNSTLLSKNFPDFIFYIIMFFVRNVAWCSGILAGLFR